MSVPRQTDEARPRIALLLLTPLLLAPLLLAACGDAGPAGLPDAPPMDTMAPDATGDTLAPTLESAGFSPRNVNVANEAELVSMVARFRDEGTGVESASAQFRGPTTAQITGFTELTLFSGDARRGRWEGFILVPKGAPGGAWEVLFVQAVDEAGNSTIWGTEELREMGIPVVLRVSSG